MAQETNRLRSGKAVIPTGGTIGILGAGQLGKMLAQAATKLGYKTHVFAPDEDPIAASAATHFTKASYTDLHALETFARSVDVITLEFENVPVAPLHTLATPVYPSPDILSVSQHRVKEKTLARSLNVETAPFLALNSLEDAKAAAKTLGMPGIIKTSTLGYDGKGQWKILSLADIEMIDGLERSAHAPDPFIYEGFVNFEKEISVIVARNAKGDIQCFEPVENVHKNHILHTTTAPANITPYIEKKALDIAKALAQKLELVGLLAIELFVTKDGHVLFNEMAPRPHNSGHWTMDACSVSQFEQAIRAVIGMPLVKPERNCRKAVMTNLIGDEVEVLDVWKAQGAAIHIYGKREIRPGRKMGHVTQVQP